MSREERSATAIIEALIAADDLARAETCVQSITEGGAPGEDLPMRARIAEATAVVDPDRAHRLMIEMETAARETADRSPWILLAIGRAAPAAGDLPRARSIVRDMKDTFGSNVSRWTSPVR